MSPVKLSGETTPTIPQGLCESPPCSVGANVQYPARGTDRWTPLMRPTKFPEIPVSLERNTEVFRHPVL